MKNILAKQTIVLLNFYINSLGFKPVIHFELEGCYCFGREQPKKKLNFSEVNNKLNSLGIEGELVPEYWKNQWEYVSKFMGQSPLKEANNVEFLIHNLPIILSLQGVEKTLIKPVVWSGDTGKLGQNCNNIFINEKRSVHIPNAVQINVSVYDKEMSNLVAHSSFGKDLQQSFLQTSLSCCLLYLPEEEAFERLQLKTQYGLAQELCSPDDISGGHQGSIALYREIGKHNQPMGVKTLLVDQYNKALVNEYNWQETARIEHRLGASSLKYSSYDNVIFALLNVIDAIHNFQQGVEYNTPSNESDVALPLSLYNKEGTAGAITFFEESHWFNESINQVQLTVNEDISELLRVESLPELLPEKLGDLLKKAILNRYSSTNEIILT